MEGLGVTCAPSVFCNPTSIQKTKFTKSTFVVPQSSPITTPCFSSTKQITSRSPYKVFTSLTSSPSKVSPENKDDDDPKEAAELETGAKEEKFDWFSEWYPVMPVCELDKRAPLAKKVLGLDVVVWWDKNERTWRVFDDACPHRLAPLSDGRIDQWGRLQCAYHGWCFGGSGDCKLIPQAPLDGPPVHTFKRACVGVYPTTVEHDIVWFWPSTEPKYKDIIKKKKPPFIPELDDPSFTKFVFMNRDIPYGYEILVENLMDPAHVPYAHYGVMELDQPPKMKVDREGGRPLELSVKRLDINGFVGRQEWGSVKFIAPCAYCMYGDPMDVQANESALSTGTDEMLLRPKTSGQQRFVFFFFCIPVSPGNSRLIWGNTKNFKGSWIENIIPKWIPHIEANLVVDSDLYLLHIEEHRIMEVGVGNWQKACFVPTKSDALVVGFRRWMIKYAGGKINWGGKFSATSLPPTPPRVQLMDRYRSHVVNCKSCSSAYKSLKALEFSLQVISIGLIGIVGATKQGVVSVAARTMVVLMAIVCFVASRWLAYFIYKNFHYHDYNHAFQ